jgi:hypothetical protein
MTDFYEIWYAIGGHNVSVLFFNFLSSSVSIITRLRAGRRRNRGSISRKSRDFSVLYRVQTGSGAQPAVYPQGTGGSLPAGKSAAAWSRLVPRLKMLGAIGYLQSPIHFRSLNIHKDNFTISNKMADEWTCKVAASLMLLDSGPKVIFGDRS